MDFKREIMKQRLSKKYFRIEQKLLNRDCSITMHSGRFTPSFLLTLLNWCI